MTDLMTGQEPQATEISLPPALRKPRLRRWEASQYLLLVYGITIAPSTLAKYATVGGGPCFNRARRVPLYPITELDAWAMARLGDLVGSTSAADVRQPNTEDLPAE